MGGKNRIQDTCHVQAQAGLWLRSAGLIFAAYWPAEPSSADVFHVWPVGHQSTSTQSPHRPIVQHRVRGAQNKSGPGLSKASALPSISFRSPRCRWKIGPEKRSGKSWQRIQQVCSASMVNFQLALSRDSCNTAWTSNVSSRNRTVWWRIKTPQSKCVICRNTKAIQRHQGTLDTWSARRETSTLPSRPHTSVGCVVVTKIT